MRAPHNSPHRPGRSSLLALLSLLLLAPVALAQEEPDAGSDDDDRGEDTTGRVPTDCSVTNYCPPSFKCVQGECEWVGIQEAEGPSCALGSGLGALLAFGVVFLPRRS